MSSDSHTPSIPGYASSKDPTCSWSPGTNSFIQVGLTVLALSCSYVASSCLAAGHEICNWLCQLFGIGAICSRYSGDKALEFTENFLPHAKAARFVCSTSWMLQVVLSHQCGAMSRVLDLPT